MAKKSEGVTEETTATMEEERPKSREIHRDVSSKTTKDYLESNKIASNPEEARILKQEKIAIREELTNKSARLIQSKGTRMRCIQNPQVPCEKECMAWSQEQNTCIILAKYKNDVGW